MFCSRSKSGQPNSSDELVPQGPSTTYELIGRVGENSASCDCRHHHKFNTTAVILSITQQIEVYSSFLYLLFLDFTHDVKYLQYLICHIAHGNIHYTQSTVALTLALIPAI